MALQVKNVARLTDGQKRAVSERAAAIRRGEIGTDITHGFITLTDVLAGVAARPSLDMQHKFVFELGWRAYFRHVWQHRGEGILRSLHEGPLPDDAYAGELPADIRLGCTGAPVVDEAVRTLYTTGLLHNHARMWLASYVVHMRKVHWRTSVMAQPWQRDRHVLRSAGPHGEAASARVRRATLQPISARTTTRRRAAS